MLCVRAGAHCVYLEVVRKTLVLAPVLQELRERAARLQAENERLQNELRKYTDKEEDWLDEETKTTPPDAIPPYLNRYGQLLYPKGSKFSMGSALLALFTKALKKVVGKDEVEGVSGLPMMEDEGNAYHILITNKTHFDVTFTLPLYQYATRLVDSFVNTNEACFYFFNEGVVREKLRRMYAGESMASLTPHNQEHDRLVETIWYCEILLVFAVGEMYLGTYDLNEHHASSAMLLLPGHSFFHQASELFTGLFSAGSLDNIAHEGGVEVCLLYAFYLQVADFTVSAFFYFGMALRVCVVLGYHADAAKDTLGRAELEHRRRLWWTVYIYERMLSSKLGLPLLLADSQVTAQLPSDIETTDGGFYLFLEAEILRKMILVTRINTQVLVRLYLHKHTSNILPEVLSVVKDLMNWQQQLPGEFWPDWGKGATRLQVNLLTEYSQGINLAVRPLLFHLVMQRVQGYLGGDRTSPGYLSKDSFPMQVVSLLEMLFRLLIDIIRSMWQLFRRNQVALFGFMDREYLYGALHTLALYNTAFGVHANTEPHLDHGLAIMMRMSQLGNFPARMRMMQVLELMLVLDVGGTGVLDELVERYTRDTQELVVPPAPENTESLDEGGGVGLVEAMGGFLEQVVGESGDPLDQKDYPDRSGSLHELQMMLGQTDIDVRALDLFSNISFPLGWMSEKYAEEDLDNVEGLGDYDVNAWV